MAQLLFTNARLIGASPREGAQVLVEGDTIREVSDRPIAAPAATTFDLKGRTLMPGLIDAHVHVTAVTLDLGALPRMPQTYIAARASHLLRAMLMRGFTTVRDAGGADLGLAQAVQEGHIVGPRLFYSGQSLSQTGGHADFRPRTLFVDGQAGCLCCAGGSLGRIVDGVDNVRRAARDELRKGATQIKIMASGGIASPTDPIGNTQFSIDEIRAIVEEAEAWSTYVMAHAYTPRAIVRAITGGVRSIEHGNLVDTEAAALMATRGAYMVPTMVTYDTLARFGAKLGLPPESVAKIGDVATAAATALDICKRAGVKIGHGSDLLGDLHVHQCDEFRLKAQVLSAAECVAAATSVNAEMMNMKGRLGAIAPGALADLLVVDGDPHQDISVLSGQGERLLAIVKGGAFFKNQLASL